MPIFQDPDRVLSSYRPWLGEEYSSDDDEPSPSQNWKGNETVDVNMGGTSPVDRGTNCYSPSQLHTSDRGELIQCIKRGENPTWVPNRSVSYHIQLFISSFSFPVFFLFFLLTIVSRNYCKFSSLPDKVYSLSKSYNTCKVLHLPVEFTLVIVSTVSVDSAMVCC
jgi:hypothetical protein